LIFKFEILPFCRSSPRTRARARTHTHARTRTHTHTYAYISGIRRDGAHLLVDLPRGSIMIYDTKFMHKSIIKIIRKYLLTYQGVQL
jgi:hypothetical protein